jgi:hypothetical protein
VSRALLAHHRQHRTGAVHWTDEADRQLALELLWRQLLEVAGVEARRIVDQHIDPTEPVDSSAHRRFGIAAARDVQCDGQQVV